MCGDTSAVILIGQSIARSGSLAAQLDPRGYALIDKDQATPLSPNADALTVPRRAVISRLTARHCSVARKTYAPSLRAFNPARTQWSRCWGWAALARPSWRLKWHGACAAAGRKDQSFADAVWLVELAPVTDAERVSAALVQALGLTLPGRSAPAHEIAAALASRHLLVVLDNCEHVLGAVGALVRALSERAPHVRVLCTSQEMLHIAGEQVFRLPALTLPVTDSLAHAEQSSAAALFVAWVRASLPTFALDENNAAAIAEICRRLDGLPLVIELAAARVPLLGVFEVRDRLNERFRLLESTRAYALEKTSRCR